MTMSDDDLFDVREPRTLSGETAEDKEKGEKGPVKRMTIEMPASLHTKAKMGCARDGVTMISVIIDAFEQRFGDIEIKTDQ